jgi:hypothetical protein
VRGVGAAQHERAATNLDHFSYAVQQLKDERGGQVLARGGAEDETPRLEAGEGARARPAAERRALTWK